MRRRSANRFHFFFQSLKNPAEAQKPAPCENFGVQWTRHGHETGAFGASQDGHDKDKETFTKLPSGKWRIGIRQDGVYRGRTFVLKREAVAWANEVAGLIEPSCATRLSSEPCTATLGDLIDTFTQTQYA